MSKQHPRAHESVARRAQLDRIKEERRARRQMRIATHYNKGAARSFAPIGLDTPTGPTYAQLLAEVRRIAMGGVMPTARQFDFAKPATWPSAEECCARFGVTWAQLAAEAGLRYRP